MTELRMWCTTCNDWAERAGSLVCDVATGAASICAACVRQAVLEFVDRWIGVRLAAPPDSERPGQSRRALGLRPSRNQETA